MLLLSNPGRVGLLTRHNPVPKRDNGDFFSVNLGAAGRPVLSVVTALLCLRLLNVRIRIEP
jgi:hypothetical protein